MFAVESSPVGLLKFPVAKEILDGALQDSRSTRCRILARK